MTETRKSKCRFKAVPDRGKLRRFTQFYNAAQSWRRVERVIARVEVGPGGSDTRFIVTNLEGGRAKHLYEWLYVAARVRRFRHRLGQDA